MKRLILGIAALIIVAHSIQAAHIQGGNITYTCVGPNTYNVTLSLLVDCFGATNPQPTNNLFFLSQCGIPFSTNANLQSVVEISDVCDEELASTSCNGGFLPGTWLVTYTAFNIVLNDPCDYEVVWSFGDWNIFGNIDNNLPCPPLCFATAYISTTIDNTQPCSESIQVIHTEDNPLVPQSCLGSAVSYTPEVINPSGNTLAFSFAPMLTDGGVSVIYEGGFSAGAPIPGITIDPATGEINFIGTQIGNFGVAILIEEFDGNGDLVSSLVHNMTFIVRLCIQGVTTFSNPSIQSVEDDGISVNATTAAVCEGNQMCVTVQAVNNNPFRSITLTSDFEALFPGATFTQTGTNPAIGTLCLDASIPYPPSTVVTIDAEDNDCDFPTTAQIQITLNILPTLVIPTATYDLCFGDDVQLDVQGDSNYNWSVLAGDPIDVPNNFSCANCGDPTVSPAVSTTYEVTGTNINPACTTGGTITVNVSLSSFTTLQIDELCEGSNAGINISPDSGIGPFAFDWTGPSGFTSNSQNINGLAAGDYTVIVTDTGLPGCTGTEAFTITNIPSPTAQMQNADVTICEGECVDLVFDLTGTAPFNLNLTNIAAQNGVNDGHVVQVCPGATTTYTLNSVTDSNNPACLTNVGQSVTVTVRPIPSATFSNPGPLCDGDNADLVLNINQPGDFVVIYNIDGVPQAVVNPATNGQLFPISPSVTTDYTITSVAYPDAPACENSTVETTTVIVNPLLTSAQTITICANESATLPDNSQVNQPGDYVVTLPSVVTGCDSTITTTVVVNPLLTSAQTITICANEFATLPDNSQVNAPGVYDVTLSSLVTGCDSTITTTVVVNPLLTSAQTITICANEFATLPDNSQVNAPGDYDVTLSSLVTGCDSTITTTVVVNPLLNSTQVFTICETEFATLPDNTQVNQPGDYDVTLSSVVTGCDSTITTTVFVNPLIQVLTLDTLCEPTNEFFQVFIEMDGGIPGTFSVAEIGTAGGAFVAGPPTTFTSVFIPNGTDVTFTISNDTVCPDEVISVIGYSCPLITDAGTMSQIPLFACEDQTVCGTWNNDGTFDGNDQLMFVLHDSPGPALGLVYAIDCDDPCFNDANTPLTFGNGVGEIQIGVTYYISAVVGNDDGSGDCVNLNHPDISVAIGQPITFQEVATATISGGGVICEGETVPVVVDFVGMPPFTFSYQIDGLDAGVNIPVDTTQFTIQASLPGIYTLSDMTNVNCPGVFNGDATVVVNPLPDVNDFSGAAEICEGESVDLILDLVGTAPWSLEISVDDGTNVTTTAVNNILASPYTETIDQTGLYTISLIEDALCGNTGVSHSFDLTVHPLPTATITSADTLVCPGGEATFTAQLTGTPPFTVIVAIDGVDEPAIVTNDDFITFTTQIDGVYAISFIADDNCQNIGTGSMSLTTLQPPVADAGPDATVCSQVDLVLGAPDDPTLEYTWTGSINFLDDSTIAQPTLNATNQTGADIVLNFLLTVFNGACEATDEVIITLQPEPLADAGPDVFLCFGESVELNATGGVSCEWNPSPSLDDDTICNPTATPLADETFTVTVFGANGCAATDDMTITVNPELTLNVVTTDLVACFQSCDAGGEFDPVGGSGNFTVEWLDVNDIVVSTGLLVEDICPGDYTVLLTDGAGCTDALSFTVTENPEYNFASVTATDPSCFGVDDGQIEVDSPEAIEFFLNNGNPQASNTFSLLPPGQYDITAVDQFGCTAQETVFLTSPPEVTISIFSNQIFFCFEETLNLEATALGGVDGFVYSWLDDQGNLLGNGNPFAYQPTVAETIEVFAEDANGCPSPSLFISLSPNEPFALEFLGDSSFVICQGESILVNILTSGGLGFQNIEWVDAVSGQVVSNSTTLDITPTVSTFYFVTLSDGCTETLTEVVDVTVNLIPQVLISAENTEGCYPVNVLFFNQTDPLASADCIWNFGDGSTFIGCVDGLIHTYENQGTYLPSLTVTSPEGCTGSAVLNVPVLIHGYPEPDFTWNPQPTTIEIQTQIFNQTPGVNSYFWTVNGQPESTVTNPVFEFIGPDLTSYLVCMTATNVFGCAASICKTITIRPELLVYVPNAFTPDGDNLNEYFKPVVRGISNQEYSFRIYNRWGEKVFETNDPEMAWNGSHQRGEFFVEPDVYVWQLKVKDLINGDKHEFSGHVTIIR